MTWRVYARPWETSELTDSSVYQPIKFPYNMTVRAVRIRLVFIGDPTFTSINCKVFKNATTTANPEPFGSALFTSSDSRTKAELVLLQDHGIKETYFEFDDVTFRKGVWYHFVINGSGYTYAESSHLAWMKVFPDPYYPASYTPNAITIGSCPFAISFIGAKF